VVLHRGRGAIRWMASTSRVAPRVFISSPTPHQHRPPQRFVSVSLDNSRDPEHVHSPLGAADDLDPEKHRSRRKAMRPALRQLNERTIGSTIRDGLQLIARGNGRLRG
jgi:hypothetical protein